MIEQHSAEEIGEHGYSHWSSRPTTPTCGEPFFVPQTIADGWEAYCPCGQWRGFFSFYEVKDLSKAREETFAALRQAHAAHVEARRLKPHPSP